jgi:hypothetical protein
MNRREFITLLGAVAWPALGTCAATDEAGDRIP